MSTNYRLDTNIALQITKILPTYLTNFAAYPGQSIISWMTAEDAAFGQKAVIDGIRHPEETVNVSSEIEYNDKYARKYAREMDMPSITDSIRIANEYYAGDIVNAMGHVSDIGQNFIEGINLLAFEGALKPLMYGISDYPNGTAGTRERPEMCAPVTTAGKWDVPTSIGKDFAQLEQTLLSKKFYGQKIVLANPIVKPMLNLVLTNTATPVGTVVQGAYGYPIIFSPWIDSDSAITAADIYMVDASAFAYTMTPISIRAFFDNNTEDWVWHYQSRFVLRPKPRHDGTEWLKGAVYTTVDLYT